MFNQISIINLARRTDKRESMQQQVAKLSTDIQIKWYDAVDGTNVEHLNRFKFTTSEWYDPSSGKAMTNGEVGCALSHWGIWSEFVDDVEQGRLDINSHVLILEDDVEFPNNFIEKANNLLNSWPTYDLMYLHRKALNSQTEIMITNGIVKANKSYWTCAYVLSYNGAKKLTQSGYLDKLIPVDEFIPIMYGCKVNGYETRYDNCEKLDAFAASPSILSLTDNAFSDSETFHSEPCKINVEQIDNLTCVYIGNTSTQSFYRFKHWLEIYGINLVISTRADVGKLLQDSYGSKMVLYIEVAPNDDVTILPCCSKRELLDKMKTYTDGILVPSESIASKLIAIGLGSHLSTWSNPIIDIDNVIFDVLQLNSEILFDHAKSKAYDVTNGIKRYAGIYIANNMRSCMVLNNIANYTGPNWNKWYGFKSPELVKSDNQSKVYISTNSTENLIELFNLNNDTIQSCCDLTNDTSILADIENFIKSDATHWLYYDSHCNITQKDFLERLIATDLNVVAPCLINKSDESHANFWPAVNIYGGFNNTKDYADWVNGVKTGWWNVPHIENCILIKRNILTKYKLFGVNLNRDQSVRFCYNCRLNNVHMYVDNTVKYGWIEDITKTLEFTTIADVTTNQKIWQTKYLHPEYLANMSNLHNLNFTEIADGIYSFPLFSEAFCQELIELAEKNNGWSAGKDNHIDKRLGTNYYENAPTVDVQLFQLGLEQQWKAIVAMYVAPIARVLYNNYKTRDINLAFVVRYKADEQAELLPHHDSSVYTINVALNRGGGVDYSGGGCRFVRQNIRVVNNPPGTCCIHPGRLTAYHEGLAVTDGTRYILVSFIN